MSFDFDKLARLALTDPDAFERERARLLEEFITQLPTVEQQSHAREFQDTLETMRKILSPADFFNYLAIKISTNLETIKKHINDIDKEGN
jgi:hypothetical protein